MVITDYSESVTCTKMIVHKIFNLVKDLVCKWDWIQHVFKNDSTQDSVLDRVWCLRHLEVHNPRYPGLESWPSWCDRCHRSTCFFVFEKQSICKLYKSAEHFILLCISCKVQLTLHDIKANYNIEYRYT